MPFSSERRARRRGSPTSICSAAGAQRTGVVLSPQFGIGSTLSFGPSGSSINALTAAVPKVAAGVTRGLFAGDLQRHWESLLAYDVKQVELDWNRIATE